MAGLLAACGDGSAQPQAPTATVDAGPQRSKAGEPATQPTTFDPPEQIDAAYVERVMTALDHVYGEAARYAVRTRQLDRPFVDHLRAIFDDENLNEWMFLWQLNAKGDFALFTDRPGDPETRVIEVITAADDCVFAAVDRSFQSWFDKPEPERPGYHIALAPLPPGRDSAGLNPTGWYLIYDGWEPDLSRPEDPCVGG